MKKKTLRRIAAGVLSGVLMAETAFTAIETVEAFAAQVTIAGEIAIDPTLHYQTLDGWGSSLCWWGNSIGSWGDKDFNGNGKPDREEIAELAFSPDYLNLNIVRYNVGGGDKPDSSIKRVEGRVPGWTVDMTGKADGTGTFNEQAFYAKDAQDMNDAGQIWMLEQANQYRKDKGDIINEVFSNSPPYYMTKTGTSTGGVKGASNLKEEEFDNFASYMARAAKWIDNDLKAKYGTGVSVIQPMNEPDPATGYWAQGSTKQEGCAFAPGDEQSRMYLSMYEALKEEGLEKKISMTASDETGLSYAINSFNKLSADAKDVTPIISAHTYSGSNSERETMKQLAASYGKKLWMSEVCFGGGTHNADVFAQESYALSKGIMNDLKIMQPSAWIAWLVADSEYECLKWNENWGLIHAVFESDGPVPDYHTNLFNEDGSVKENVPKAGYWEITKQFYTLMQYSKFLKAGYTMIDINDANMCAAVSPDGKELVIVAQNFSNQRTISADLSKFTKSSTAKLYRTSENYSCEQIGGNIDVTGGVLEMILPKNSVSTYVVSVETDMENFRRVVNANTAKAKDAQADTRNVFDYSGKWNEVNAAYEETTDKTAKATFQFDGTQAILYASRNSKGPKVDVIIDGGASVTVDLSSEKELTEAVLCNTGKLAKGEHTITIRMNSASAADSKLTLVKAVVYQGEKELKGASTIRKVNPYDQTLQVQFDEVSGASAYTVKYGTDIENLDQKIETSNTSAFIQGLENGTTYYIQVVDDLGGESNIVSGVPSEPTGNLYYFVDAGTDSPDTVAAGESLGIYNSTLEQEYGQDPITGKNWGYVSEGSEAYYTDADSLTSVRECQTGLEYKFELPKGTYMVTVAMADPWTNGSRFTDIYINDELRAEAVVPLEGAIKILKTEITEPGELSVKAVKNASNADQAPMISYIKISAYDPDDTSIANVPTQEAIGTINGLVPILPEKVLVDANNGETIEVPVVWNEVNEKMFKGDTNDVINVTGVIKQGEENFKVTQPVVIVDANTEYFIDCTRISSQEHTGWYKNAKISNSIGDQKYGADPSTGKKWGYLMGGNGGGRYGGSSLNTTGWYDPVGDKIQYKMELEAGKWFVTFGFHEWWNGRTVDLKGYFGDSTEADVDWGSFSTDPGNDSVMTVSFTLEEKQDVTISVERKQKEGSADMYDAPVLSWLKVGGPALYTDRIAELVNIVRTIDQTKYTNEERDILRNSIVQAIDLFARSDVDQAQIDEVKDSIEGILYKEDLPVAKSAEEKIRAVGDAEKLTLADEAILLEAQKAYEELTADQKKLLAKEDVDNLNAAIKNYNKLKAEDVTAKIKAIGSVSLASKTAVESAKAAYEALTAAQKKLITKADLKTLETAVAEYEQLKAADDAKKAEEAKKAAQKKPAAAGTLITVGTNIFVVTNAGAIPEAAFKQSTEKNAKKVVIPALITQNDITYQVTAIADNACKGNKKLSAITIPVTVTGIGKNAFSGCISLKKITIPKNVASIGAKAFAGDKNLKKITINSTVLKKVGGSAFKGIHKKAVIKVPKKQKKAYQKLLKKKGQDRKSVV